MPYRLRGVLWLLFLPILALIASGCGPDRAPATLPANPPKSSPWAIGSWLESWPSWATHPTLPPTPTPEAYPHLPPPPTETAYPWPPTRTPSPTRDNRLSPTSLTDLHPIPTPAPAPVILGTAIAPPEEQEQYLSCTVVLAPVGTGPGEIGYKPPIQCQDCCPPAVKATLFAVGFHGEVYIYDKSNRRIVQFDAQGSFVRSIALEDKPLYRTLLAAGPAGEVCLYDEDHVPLDQAGVACYEQGQWTLLYPKPGWLGRVRELRITGDGTVWLQADGSLPDSPFSYAAVMVPVGQNGVAYDEPRQQELAVLGFIPPSGRVAGSSYSRDAVYLHNREGVRIYAYRRAEWLLDIDAQGDLLTIEELVCDTSLTRCFRHRVRKYTVGGVMVASFDIITWAPEYPSFLAVEGSVYRFTFNETTMQYRVVRWGR